MNLQFRTGITAILVSSLFLASNASAIEFRISGQVSRMIVAPDDDSGDNGYQDFFIKCSFGKLSIGNGDGAANGSIDADLSGTALGASSNHPDNWGDYIIIGDDIVNENITWDSIFTMRRHH